MFARGVTSVSEAAARAVRGLSQFARRYPALAALLALGAVLVAVAALRTSDPLRALANERAEVRIRRLADDIRTAADEFALDPYVVAGMVFAESSGRPWAESKSGALGLLQLKLETAAEQAQVLGIAAPSKRQLLREPALNLRLGAGYLGRLVKRQKGDVRQALMAYNTGPTRFNRWLREAGGFEPWLEKVEREQGPPKPGSVRHYAERVLSQAEAYRSVALLE
jgi:soluble lytic murein transglycosylase